jgi:GH25 family lysozyme M1 (1,4-beta-N-acetylmuramidase)
MHPLAEAITLVVWLWKININGIDISKYQESG